MQFLDLTLPSPAENLALDEALLEEAETAPHAFETLRLWEPAAPLVVVGRSSQVEAEVNVAACRADGVPILRRASGGASIVTGRGCLMYAVVLSYRLRPELRSLDATHRLALDTLSESLEPIAAGIARRGTSDAAWGERKISGNSVRCKRNALLYHGTLLYDFPLELVARYLARPPREPEYRQGRAHGDFIANLPADPAQLRTALAQAWQAKTARTAWPQELVARLVAEKYGRDAWNWQH